MKAIRRFLSLAMVCLLLCGLLPGFALAEDTAETGKIVLGGDTAGQPGDTVKVEVKVEECPGIMGMKFSPLYDAAVLKLTNTEVSVGAPWDNTVVQETGVVLLDTGADAALSGVIATYTFQILETAAAGETQVNLEVSAGSGNGDADEQRVNFNVTAAIITVAGSGPVENASNITSCSTNFEGKLQLNVYIVLSEEIAADPGAYVSATFSGETTKHSVPELLTGIDSRGRVKVVQDVFATMMRENIMIQVFNGEGQAAPLTYKETTDVTDGFSYNMLTYLKDRQVNSTNPKMVELARAAELYGIATQVYFPDGSVQPTAEEIAEMKAAAAEITIPAECDERTSGTLPEGITKRTKTVMFESDNTLRMYFYLDDADLDKYTFTLNGAEVTPMRLESGRYYVEQKNVASAELSVFNTFTVSDGVDTFTAECSALSYAYGRQQSSANADMVNLAKLLYRYSLAADAYFG